MKKFRVASTADFYWDDGSCKYRDMGLDILEEQPHVEYCVLGEYKDELGPEQIKGINGLIVGGGSVTAGSVSVAGDLLAIGRFGVGYDTVQVDACTEADVAVFITVGAVDRSMAEATIAMMMGLSFKMLIKDRLLRDGKWDDRSKFMGGDLRGKTLGVVGLGGIGREVVRLLRGFDMSTPLAYDPYVDGKAAEDLGVRMVELDELRSGADFVSIHCPLNDNTRDLIGAREIGLMGPEAYLINTARGGIVNEDALYEALAGEKIAGAALDCVVGEPIREPHRFRVLDNVILAPHSIGWTHELFRDIGRAACRGMVDLSVGREPRGVVNPEVFERPSFREKWAGVRADK